MNRWWNNLSFKIPLFGMLASLIPLLIFGFVVSNVIEKSLLQAAISANGNLADLIVDNAEELLCCKDSTLPRHN